MIVEKIAYGGWDNCLRMANENIELIITTDVGPRVIRFGFIGGQNLFKEFEDQMGVTEGDEWMSIGGHRLWHAPEVHPRTYVADFDDVEYTIDGNRVTLIQKTEATTGLQKKFIIELDENRDEVKLMHTFINHNMWGVEMSPWSLSVMAAGGTAIIPQEDFIPHGEGVGETFLPARPIVVWPFTSMGDSRYIWGTKYIQMSQDDSMESKQKIGMTNTKGWTAYTLNNQVFVKKFPYSAEATYPDTGCNCEFFTMPGFLEVETLGELKVVEPGSSVDHFETWGLFKQDVGKSDAELDVNLLPLVDKVSGC